MSDIRLFAMRIITLTTDMGITDYYTAVLKGNLFKLAGSVQIVDISHHVKPFNIAEASYYINGAFREFPEGTIHIIGVDSEPVINNFDGCYPCIMLFEGHYFIANDNGIFALILKGERPEKFWRIDDVLSNPKGLRFPVKNIFVPIAAKIATDIPVDQFASEEDSWRVAHVVTPTIAENLIKGAVIHIDHYGNAITNITREIFDRFKGEPFTITFRRKEYFIDVISTAYNDVAPGERLALFNDSGYLEIAINKGATGNGGGANSLFGLHHNDPIRIEFTPQGSAKTISSLFDM